MCDLAHHSRANILTFCFKIELGNVLCSSISGRHNYVYHTICFSAPCMLNLTTSSVTPTTANVTWVRPDTYTGIASYSIELVGRAMQEIMINSTENVLNFMLSELDPFTTYTLRLTASNSQSSQMCTTVVTTAEGGMYLIQFVHCREVVPFTIYST